VGTSDHHAVEASNTFAAAACVVVAGDDVAAVADAGEASEEVCIAQELNRVVCVTS